MRLLTVALVALLVTQCVPQKQNTDSQTRTAFGQKMLRLGIFYGYPQTLGSTPERLVAYINQYDLFVFGDGLQNTTHAQHQLLVEAMKQNIRAKVFGYISVGKIKSWSETELSQHISDWKTKVNVHGIFIDEMDLSLAPAGTDMPTRMGNVMKKVRESGLLIFGNGPNPVDLFTAAGGIEKKWQPGDFYLAENFAQKIANTDDFNRYRFNVNRLKSFSARLGVRVICYQDTDLWPSGRKASEIFDQLSFTGKIDGCAGVGATSLSKFETAPEVYPFPAELERLETVGDLVIDKTKMTVRQSTNLGEFIFSLSEHKYEKQSGAK